MTEPAHAQPANLADASPRRTVLSMVHLPIQAEVEGRITAQPYIVVFGVVTAGFVLDNWKLEASAFRGREPDQHRFDIEERRLDSYSARLTWNPIRELSLQVSAGHLHSPEQLSPEVDEDRITASATYTQPFGQNNLWSSTFAWGRKMNHPATRWMVSCSRANSSSIGPTRCSCG